MSSRNVAIRKDVYEALDREKRGSESFTQVVLRLLGQRGPMEEILGSWSTADARRDDAHLRALRTPPAHRGGRR